MMPSYRCTRHEEDLWPIRPELARCPECNVQMGRYAKDPNVSDSEVNHALFVAFLRRTGRLLAEEAA